ncbi:hypothetical protein Mapa_017181 [Marchantia paleacea]|nr:hypothetical protein Mapa_017181 [Marchantia paleacea]
MDPISHSHALICSCTYHTASLVSRFQCWLSKLHILHIPDERTVLSVSFEDNW